MSRPRHRGRSAPGQGRRAGCEAHRPSCVGAGQGPSGRRGPRDVLFPPAVLGDEAFVVRDVENVGRVREDGVFLLELRFLVDGELPRCGDGGVEWEGKFDFIHDGIFDFSLGFSLGFGRRGVRVKGAGHSGV